MNMKAIERSGPRLRVELYPNGKARTPVIVWDKDTNEQLTHLDEVRLETIVNPGTVTASVVRCAPGYIHGERIPRRVMSMSGRDF